jgi:hypothetical protein
MTTVRSRVIMQHRAQMSSPILSTCTHHLTSVLTPLLKLYQTGSGTCSLDPAATSKSCSKLWLTRTTGAWPKKSYTIESSMTTSRLSPSRLSNINVTSMLPEHGSHHVSPASCSPVPPSGLLLCKTYLGRWERYVWGGKGAAACHTASMFVPRRWRMNRDVCGRPS